MLYSFGAYLVFTQREALRIIHGGIIGNRWTIPFHELHFHFVPLIPYSAIPKTVLVRYCISSSANSTDAKGQLCPSVLTAQAVGSEEHW